MSTPASLSPDPGHRPPTEPAPAIASRRPILVTGAHRSGTTWVGRMLALAPRVYYLGEVFNPRPLGEHGYSAHTLVVPSLEHWYQHIHAGNQARHRAPIGALLGLHYPLAAQLRRAARPQEKLQTAWAALRMAADRWLRRPRPLLKDPIALMAADWLHTQFGVQPVVVVRHPAAFAASLKRLRWYSGFKSFSQQPELVERRLARFAGELRAPPAPDDLIGQAILLWRLLYTVVDQYRHEWPSWLYVRHEDLSRDPQTQFAGLYQRLGLRWSDRVQRQLAAHTSAENPGASPAQAVHQLTLNSRQNVSAWRSLLTPEEAARVRAGTADVYYAFYTDADWDEDA